MSSITSRQFSEPDKEELNDSYNKFTHRSRTIKQFEWEWLKTPEGWGSIWLLIENDSGKIVGSHGLIPIKFGYFGKDILAGKTENTFIHQPYAARGLYYPFEARFIEEAKDRFAFLFTTAASGAPGRIRLKLGYVIVGGYANYMKVIKWPASSKWVTDTAERFIHNKLLITLLMWAYRLVSIFLMPFFHRRGKIVKELAIEKIDDINTIADEWDVFWQLSKANFGITADRNSHYLKWRIFDNPNLNNEFYLARLDGEIAGYAVTRELGNSEAMIVDIVARDNSKVIFNTILTRIVNIHREKGTSEVHMITLHSKDVLNKVLKRNGFISFYVLEQIVMRFAKIRPPVLMAKVLNDGLDAPKASDPNNWYFTDILSEGR